MPEQENISFAALVLSLASTAAIHLGDVADPGSGTTQPPDLEAASQMIAILEVLDTKTKGNLTAEEHQLLEQVLYELRMRFIEVRDQQPGGAPARGPAAPAGESQDKKS